MKRFDLTGRVAIVTGGNQGIGFGIAHGLAEAGAAVVVAGRRRDANSDAVKRIETVGGRAVAIEADMQDEASCRALCTKTVEHLGRLDILVNNAGIANRKQPQDHTSAEWRKVIDVNLSGAFWCAQEAYPAMLRAGGGRSSISDRCCRSSALRSRSPMGQARVASCR
jgi:2-dehydro-3-deoxy-D-gluconate 5-dehydrogenase